MFPSSTSSSSSQGSMGPTGGGLFRYGSAPSSVLTRAVDDSVNNIHHHEFDINNYSTRSSSLQNPTAASTVINNNDVQRGGASSSSSSLVRHSSSPAGFLNHLASAATSADIGFSITRGVGSSYNSKGIGDNSQSNVSRMNSQLSFTRPKEALSRICEETENVADGSDKRSNHHSNAFTMGLWDDNTNPLTFSVKHAKNTSHRHVVDGPDTRESQFQFGLAQEALELTTMDKLMHNIPQDSVPCKIRAKRGCATHPRSIAERERRTRISGKLKKLQDLVPNMDKQTSYADMLDLAVQHIRSLQNEVHKLHKELDSCTCGCKKNTGS